MTNKIKLNLQLHDGAAGAAGAAAGDGGASSPAKGTAQTVAVETSPLVGQKAATDKQPRVAYGKQPAMAGPADEGAAKDAPPQQADSTEAATEADNQAASVDKKAAWKQLIEGDYKEEFGLSVKQAVERRFKQIKPLEERLGQLTPIVEMLAGRYGVDSADPQQVLSALEADNVYWEEAADEAGMTVEQYRKMKQLEQENARFQADLQRQEAERQARQQIAEWEQQAEEIKAIYPHFDLRAECEDPHFVKMLAHVPMRTAYEALHMSEIMHGAMAQTARVVEKGITENIRAKGQRPAEAGLTPTPGVEIKSDPAKLTRADRKRIRELVAKGERITF